MQKVTDEWLIICFGVYTMFIISGTTFMIYHWYGTTLFLMYLKVPSEAVLLAVEASRHLQDSVPWDHCSTSWSFWQCVHWAQEQRIPWHAITQVHFHALIPLWRCSYLNLPVCCCCRSILESHFRSTFMIDGDDDADGDGDVDADGDEVMQF